jgi:hypothetical protein
MLKGILWSAVAIATAAACSSGSRARTVTVTPQGDTIISHGNQPMASVAGSIKAGTKVEATMQQEVRSSDLKVGDVVSASLTNDIKDVNGDVLFHPGTTVQLRVVNIQPPMDNRESGTIGFDVRGFESNGKSYQVASSVSSTDTESRDRGPFDDKRTIAIGAGAGAVVGGLISGSVKGAAVGAVLGGAAGAVVNSQTGQREVVIPQGTRMEFKLEQPVVILIS